MFNIYPKLFSMEYGATTFSFYLGGWSFGTWLDRTFIQALNCILCFILNLSHLTLFMHRGLYK